MKIEDIFPESVFPLRAHASVITKLENGQEMKILVSIFYKTPFAAGLEFEIAATLGEKIDEELLEMGASIRISIAGDHYIAAEKFVGFIPEDAEPAYFGNDEKLNLVSGDEICKAAQDFQTRHGMSEIDKDQVENAIDKLYTSKAIKWSMGLPSSAHS